MNDVPIKQGEQSRTRYNIAFGLILAVFFGLRFVRTSLPYFIEWDEYSVFYTCRYPLDAMLRDVIAYDAWPPLGFWIYKGPAELFNFSLHSFRCTSLAFSLANLLLLGRFLRGRFGDTTALYGMGMMAVSPLHVTYDMLGRVYALLQLEILLLLIALVCLLENPRPRHWVLFSVSCVAAIYTHMWGGIVCAAAFLLLGMHCVVRRRWGDLGALFGVGALLVVAYSPYLAVFQSQLRCGEYFDMARIHPRIPWHEYVWGTVVGILGSKLQAVALCALAVVTWSMSRAKADNPRVFRVLLGVPLLAVALGAAYSVMQTPVFNPYRQGMLFSLPVIACLAIWFRRMSARWVVFSILVVLSLNTARLVWGAHQRFQISPAELSVTDSLVTLDLEGRSLYFVEDSFPQSFHALHAKMSRDHAIRDLWPYRPEWRRKLLETFLAQDLAKGPVVLLLRKESELARWALSEYKCNECVMRPDFPASLLVVEVTGSVAR